MWSPASATFRIASVLAALPRRDEQAANAALECGDAILDRLLRGVADARVDGAELAEREPRGRLRGVLEDEGRGLVDGKRAGAGF